MIAVIRPRIVSLKGTWHRVLYIHSRKSYIVQAHCTWSDHYWKALDVWVDLYATQSAKVAQQNFSAFVNCGDLKIK